MSPKTDDLVPEEPDLDSAVESEDINSKDPATKKDGDDSLWKQIMGPLNSLVSLAKDFRKDVPGYLQFFALIMILLIIAGLVFGFRDAIIRGDTIGIIATVGIFIVVLLAMGLGSKLIAKQQKQLKLSEHKRHEVEHRLTKQQSLEDIQKSLANQFAGDGSATIAWIRLVPHLPLRPNLLGTLNKELVRLRATVVTALDDLGAEPPIRAKLVRANIFLPDTRRAEVGEVCGLFIPESLHVNMLDPRERNLVFRTDEGLTGRVFVQEEAEGAVFDTAAKEWHRVTFFGQPPDPQEGPDYTLTEYQRELICPQLRWVMSFPIKVKDGRSYTTVGVVNIDGIEVSLAPEKMKELFLRLVLGNDNEENKDTSVIPAFPGLVADEVFDRVAILLAKGRLSQ